jgi:hypothetical protein
VVLSRLAGGGTTGGLPDALDIGLPFATGLTVIRDLIAECFVHLDLKAREPVLLSPARGYHKPKVKKRPNKHLFSLQRLNLGIHEKWIVELGQISRFLSEDWLQARRQGLVPLHRKAGDIAQNAL